MAAENRGRRECGVVVQLFYARPYDQFGGGRVQGVETTVVLALAVPVLAIRDDLDQLADVLTETLDELRDLARGVHPAILAEAGLGSALQGLARRSALPVRLHLHADGRLPAESEATAYYVVCEAFANAVKHARASAIDIGVDIVEGMLTVRVSDDGVGADASCGSGLTGIRDRVEAVGGTLAVHSPPGSGTVLTARLPPGDPFG